MKLRDKLRKTAKRSGLDTDWITWRRQKNRVNNILRKERNIKNEENTIKLEQDSTSREIWNMIKKKAGWIKSLSPVSLSVAGKLITSPKEIGNELNKYWITRIENLCKEFINITMDPTQPLVKIWENWQGKNNVKTFEFQPITVKRMRALFKSLKKSHSECRDGLSNNIIITGQEALIHPMTYLTNKCIENNEFPTLWKLYRSIGLYKNKGDRNIAKNYRPISLLNPMSKLVEKELLSQLDSHMRKNNLWNKNNFAYKANHSTMNALMDIIETWSKNIDQNYQNMNMMLDLSAAFDCVNHSTLKRKMEIYKYGTNSITLVQSYLNYRSQLVTVGGKDSSILWTRHGVPQGSILGPFLFNLYVNELPAILNLNCEHKEEQLNIKKELFNEECDLCGIMMCYADDSTVILKTMKNSFLETSQKLDKILDTLKQFLGANQLKLNIDKTQLLRTTTRQQLAANGEEKIKLSSLDTNGKPIAPNSTAKLLGVTFSSNLTWASHLEKGGEAVITRCKKKLGALKFVASYCTMSFKKRLADACVMSRLVYGIQLWGMGVKCTVMKRIQAVQNLAACWVTGLPKWTKTELLLETINWLSINQLAYYHTFLSIWKIREKKEPFINIKVLDRNMEYDARIDLTKNTWCQKGQSVYWTLPLEIINEEKVSIFKKRLKTWIKTNIPIHKPPD